MKIRHILIYSFSAYALLLGATAQADDLIQVYNQAVHNDPTFKQAEADWYATRENLPIARAAYLPLLEITGSWQRNYVKTRPVGAPATDGYNWSRSWTATLTQPIFDMAAWSSIQGAKAQVKSATATYLGSIQDLMQRTANAYFDVLEASDKLRYTIANKNAVHRQLVTAEQQFKVGLIAITGVYDAQSRYDQTVADEISDRNNLYNKLEDLRAITGQHYLSLKGINNQVPLVLPQPSDINQWVHTAEMQNYTLKAQNYTVIFQRENIKQQSAGRLPVIDAVGNYGRTHTSRNFDGSDMIAGPVAGSVGLSLDFQPFQGGLVFANTAQARYQYLSSVSQLEEDHRTVVKDTRKSYLGITSGISRIQADKKSIQSAQKALKATEAGYVVGTRTMVDVLNDLTTLYRTQQQFADDQYAYIESIIDLKEQAGTLGFTDLQQIDGWLKRNVKFDIRTKVYKPITYAKSTNTHNVDATPHQKSPARTKPSKKSPTNKHSRQPTKKPPVQSSAAAAPNSTSQAMAARYAIQVYAARGDGEAKFFVYRQRNTLPGARVVKQGQWYKVLYGDYATHGAAKRAEQALPNAIKANHPWIVKRTAVVADKAKPVKAASRVPATTTQPAEQQDHSALPVPSQLQIPTPASS